LALATLVAFGACDNGGGNKITTPVTGTISGTVSIEATGASGVTVTLSSGTTATTDGSGNYSFSNVPAGAYTVSISGFPSDATFATSAKAAVIASAAQVVTVDFSGSYIRTSAIIGSVKDGSGAALSGVTVAVSGPGTSASKTTDNTGQTDPFTGLRAGAYTVTISGYDATNYTCATTSQSVTLATGELQVVPFTCTLKTTASISGSLFLDESAPQDSVFESSLESKLAAANVPILLEGGTVNDTMTVMTDATGGYTFPNLAAGSYRVTYKGVPADVPGNVAFSGAPSEIVTITAGASATVNFPFVITQQAIKVYSYLGAGVAPIPGWKIDLYDTQADAQLGGAAGKLAATATTDSTGAATFRFARSADVGPNGTPADGIVFARSLALPAGAYTMTSASPIIEIHFPRTDSVMTAPDTLSAVYGQVVVKVHVTQVDTALPGWSSVMLDNKDSTAAVAQSHMTNAKGNAYYTVTPTLALPDTLWFRVGPVQAGANGHGFTATPSAGSGGTSAGQYLKVIWDGTILPADTVDGGSYTVKYTDQDVVFQAHHEVDDSTSVPTFTKGDNLAYVSNISMEPYKVHSDGTETSAAAPVAATAGTGIVTFANVPVDDSTYSVHARSTAGTINVLNDTTLTMKPDGVDQVFTDTTLKGGAGASSFAYKYNNGVINGTLQSVDGLTAVAGARVMIQATADNIQPDSMGTDSTVVKTGAGGAFSMTGLRDGPYMVSVQDSTGVWSYLNTLKTTSAPLSSGSANNTDAHSGVRTVTGPLATKTANFQAYRMDTKVVGMVVNDRDADNTLDPADALSGAMVKLYRDNSGAITLDTLVDSTTTDANGQYTFSGLQEGRYVVMGQSTATDAVLRALSQDTVVAHPSAGTPTWGRLAPPKLPVWDYNNTAFLGGTGSVADFIHLANNTLAKGMVVDNVTSKGVANMTVSMRRCKVSTGAAKPPVAVTAGPPVVGCTQYLGTTVNTVTDSTGAFSFANLQEGVYEITPQPTTVGSYTTSTPSQALYLQKNDADVETLTFKVN
jgi:hypothetical protein